MKGKARVDANQKELVKYFRAHGFYVLHIHQLKNCCDLMISKGLVTGAVEVKDGSKCPSARKLSEGELKFKNEWQGLWYLCETLKDADKIMQDMEEYIHLIYKTT